MKQCPNGHMVSGDMKFCPMCGAELVDYRPMSCPYCGKELAGNEKFCPTCGAQFERNGSNFNQSVGYVPGYYQKKNNNSTLLIVTGIIALGVMIIGLLLLVIALISAKQQAASWDGDNQNYALVDSVTVDDESDDSEYVDSCSHSSNYVDHDESNSLSSYDNSSSDNSSSDNSLLHFYSADDVYILLRYKTFVHSSGVTLRYDDTCQLYINDEWNSGIFEVLRYTRDSALIQYHSPSDGTMRLIVNIVGNKIQITDPLDGSVFYQK